MNIKYTTDGRKVLVVGKLNAEQSIVQEIFVSNGQEIPRGENFVVSSLHDAPAESWKAKSLREMEEKYEREKKALEKQLSDARARLGKAETQAKERANALLLFAKNSDNAQLQALHAFMSGEITHFYRRRYGQSIFTWDDVALFDSDTDYGRLKIEGIKLVSLYGSFDGKLDYRLNRYRDGSGHSEFEIVPCRSYAEALALAQADIEAEAELFIAGKRHSFDTDAWSKIEGIAIPTAAKEKADHDKRASQLRRIEELRQGIAKIESEMTPALN